MHVKSEGSASQCRRHQEIAKKAQIIRTNRERRAEAKKGYCYITQTSKSTFLQSQIYLHTYEYQLSWPKFKEAFSKTKFRLMEVHSV